MGVTGSRTFNSNKVCTPSNWSEISSKTPTIDVLMFKTSVRSWFLTITESNVPGWFLATKKLYFLLNCANSADVVPTLAILSFKETILSKFGLIISVLENTLYPAGCRAFS